MLIGEKPTNIVGSHGYGSAHLISWLPQPCNSQHSSEKLLYSNEVVEDTSPQSLMTFNLIPKLQMSLGHRLWHNKNRTLLVITNHVNWYKGKLYYDLCHILSHSRNYQPLLHYHKSSRSWTRKPYVQNDYHYVVTSEEFL